MLDSGDHDEVSLALIHVEREWREQPSSRLAARLMDLCSDDDPDIRNEAVQAAGFHRQIPEAFPVLVRILEQVGEDEIVLHPAPAAASELTRNHDSLKESGLGVLARTALNEKMPKPVRDSAYALAPWTAGRISPDAFAKLSVASDVAIDRESMAALVNSSVSG